MNIAETVGLQRKAYQEEQAAALLNLDSRASFFAAYHERRDMLLRLQQLIEEHQEDIHKALRQDLGKSSTESLMTETGMILSEIKYVLRHLKRWMRPRRVPGSLSTFPGRSFIFPEPYGVALILAPWNYPFQLSMAPLIAAIAAGNRCVLKPSEHAPATAEILQILIEQWVKPDRVAVVPGGADVSAQLLEEKFDYIFFTGSTQIGRIVMQKAAERLTPVTLELGGKSPCIVEADADLELAARRIAFGKGINAGQTCVAPDYLLVHEEVRDRLLELIKKEWTSFYGEHPLASEDLPRIVNERHYARLMKLMENETAYCGGNGDGHKLSPTLLTDISWDSPVMQQEIFGPILPVITYRELREAAAEVTRRDRPLACYVFTADEDKARAVIRSISFGGGCVNDTLVHLGNPRLPFGGVGQSGLGAYHGKFGFDTFTHYKSVLFKGKADFPFRYPPFSDTRYQTLKQWMK